MTMKTNKPKYIILHHSLTSDTFKKNWDDIKRYHVNVLKWKDIGYHYGIEKVNNRYSILKGRNINEVGAHCKQEGMNHKSIGICCIGNFDKELMCDEMFFTLKLLIEKLLISYEIKKENIRLHREYATYKSCPGLHFPIRKLLTEIYKGFSSIEEII